MIRIFNDHNRLREQNININLIYLPNQNMMKQKKTKLIGLFTKPKQHNEQSTNCQSLCQISTELNREQNTQAYLSSQNSIQKQRTDGRPLQRAWYHYKSDESLVSRRAEKATCPSTFSCGSVFSGECRPKCDTFDVALEYLCKPNSCFCCVKGQLLRWPWKVRKLRSQF